MKVTLAILTLLFAFVANAQVPERDLKAEEECEAKALQAAKVQAQEIMASADRLYNQKTTLSNFRGGTISFYNVEKGAYRSDVSLVFTADTGGDVREFVATMSADDTCERIENYAQVPVKSL